MNLKRVLKVFPRINFKREFNKFSKSRIAYLIREFTLFEIKLNNY